MKIHHFAYEVSDIDAAIEFYTSKLGFTVQFPKTVDSVQHEAFAILALDGGRLELLQCLDETNQAIPFEPVPVRPHATPHLAFEVEDFDQTLAMLQAEDIPLLLGPFETPGAARWMYVLDPDQNVIEFCQFS